MDVHFHTVQDTVGVNTNDGVKIARLCGLCKTAYGGFANINCSFFCQLPGIY